MANSVAARKRVRTASTKTIQNQAVRSDLRTAIKKAQIAIIDNAADKAEVVKTAVIKIDRASGRGIVHANKAARQKSQLVTALNKA